MMPLSKGRTRLPSPLPELSAGKRSLSLDEGGMALYLANSFVLDK
jgi:hypothetical protein